MARYSRYEKEEEEERRPRRRPAKSAPPMVPVLALLVVIAGAIVLARMAAQDQRGDEPAKPTATKEELKEEIFRDVPVEVPPVRGGRREGTSRAPTGLANNELWIEALKTADEAATILAAASKAKLAGDHATWNTKGKQSKELYNQALESTALWEEELQAEYGDTDRQVRQIMAIRTKWFKKLAALHKTTSR